MPLTITGTRSASKTLSDIADRCENVSPVWNRVGNIISSRVNRQFMTQGAYFGTPWKRLTPAYAKRKGGGKILVLTGDLKSSFTSRPMSVEIHGKNSAEFGSNRNTAVWHHYGTFKDGKRVNPPRKILVVTRELRSATADVVARWIRSGKAI